MERVIINSIHISIQDILKINVPNVTTKIQIYASDADWRMTGLQIV